MLNECKEKMITDMNGSPLEVGVPVSMYLDGRMMEGVVTQIFLDQPTSFREGVFVEVDFDGESLIGSSYKLSVIVDEEPDSIELLRQDYARQMEILNSIGGKLDTLLEMVRPAPPPWKPSESEIIACMEQHGITWEEAHGKLLDERAE